MILSDIRLLNSYVEIKKHLRLCICLCVWAVGCDVMLGIPTKIRCQRLKRIRTFSKLIFCTLLSLPSAFVWSGMILRNNNQI